MSFGAAVHTFRVVGPPWPIPFRQLNACLRCFVPVSFFPEHIPVKPGFQQRVSFGYQMGDTLRLVESIGL